MTLSKVDGNMYIIQNTYRNDPQVKIPLNGRYINHYWKPEYTHNNRIRLIKRSISDYNIIINDYEMEPNVWYIWDVAFKIKLTHESQKNDEHKVSEQKAENNQNKNTSVSSKENNTSENKLEYKSSEENDAHKSSERP